MMIIDEIKEQLNVMMRPSAGIKSRTLGDSLKYYYKISIVPLAVSLLLIFAFGTIIINSFGSEIGTKLAGLGVAVIAGLAVLLFWVIEPVSLLLGAAILQLIGGNLFGTFKGQYNDTFSALVYAASTSILFLWAIFIPVAGILVLILLGVWAFVMQIIGLAKLQKTTRLSAFAIMLCESVVLGILSYVVIIAVVLGSLFSLGLFSSGSLLGTSCIAAPGFLCSNPALHSGNLTFTVGQATGNNWSSWGIAFVPMASGASAYKSSYTYSQFHKMPGALVSGGSANATLFVSQGESTASGEIFACYVLNGTINTPNVGSCGVNADYVQVATLDVKAS